MKPRTMSRALARGVPSGFFDHLSNMRLVKVLDRLSFFRGLEGPDLVVKERLQFFHLGSLELGPLLLES